MFVGLVVAGLAWLLATVVAALIQVGPASDLACPGGGGFREAQSVELQVVPFGPVCRFDDAASISSTTWGPAPIWGRALLIGSVTATVGAAGLVWIGRRSRPVDGDAPASA